MAGKVPVYPGARHPLVRDWKTVETIHGRDGMGGSNFPKAMQRPEEKRAADAIVEIINSNPGEITLVEIAPMTNIALALRIDPTIAKKVKHFYFMGGTNHYPGNTTPAAEFNMWVDPDAAKIVLESGMPTTMVGWEICMRYAVIDSDAYREIRAMNTGEAEFFIAINRAVRKFYRRHRGMDATSCPDSITMSIVLNPRVATKVRPNFVEVDNQSDISRGATVVDDSNLLHRRSNINVVYEASQSSFRKMLYDLLRGERV
jgi:purine nucleosidase